MADQNTYPKDEAQDDKGQKGGQASDFETNEENNAQDEPEGYMGELG